MSSCNMTTNMVSKGSEARFNTSPKIKRSEKNGVSKSQNSDMYDYVSLKRSLKKSQSSTSLLSASGDYNFHDCSYAALQGSPKAMSRSKENLVSKGNGRVTIGHEPRFRERLPSFTVRRQVTATELQTHFAVYKFVPRHSDELQLNVGDAVFVKRVHEDLWCEGRNLKTGESGIFPSRYVSDVLSHTGTKFDFSENGVQFFLRFLGSVEVFEFKGNTILCQAISKVLSERNNSKLSDIPPCTLEVDYTGIQLIDHGQENEKKHSKSSLVGRLFSNDQKVSAVKFFFKLRDVTFCGCYPSSPRYFGFVTKHPSEHRFACHTFMSEYSTEPVAKAIGQAFRQFSVSFAEQSSSK